MLFHVLFYCRSKTSAQKNVDFLLMHMRLGSFALRKKYKSTKGNENIKEKLLCWDTSKEEDRASAEAGGQNPIPEIICKYKTQEAKG